MTFCCLPIGTDFSMAWWIRLVVFVIARRVSSGPCKLERSMLVDCMQSLNRSQSALCQFRLGLCWFLFVVPGRVRKMVRELWSDVVSWLMAILRIDLVMVPRERQWWMVEGLLLFLGWWMGMLDLLSMQK